MSVEWVPPCASIARAGRSNGTCSEQDGALLARQWFPVARVDKVVAKPKQLSLLGVRLAVYRMPDGVRIGRDKCPHRGLPLSTGRVEGDELVCAYHGLRFGSDGQCRKAPEKLALKAVNCFSITLFPAVERHGLVWTCLDPRGEPGILDIRLKTDGFEQSEAGLPFELRPEDWIDWVEFDFSNDEMTIDDDHQKSLRDLALNEYQRLFNEIESNAMARAISPPRA